MVKVTVVVEGEPPDVVQSMRRLALGDPVATVQGVSDAAVPAEPATAEPEPVWAVPEGDWNSHHVRTFWEFLAADAREIYRRVARENQDHRMSRELLLDALNLTARELSGRLSSQGHAVRRIRRYHNVSLPHPMSFDSASQEYQMRSDVAGTIKELGL